MKMNRYKKIGFAVVILGLMAGSILTNMTYESNYYFLAELNMNLLQENHNIDLNMQHYASYIITKRVSQLLFLAVLLKLFVMEAVLIVLGFFGAFAFGMFLTYQLLQGGIGYVAVVFKAIFPQWIFYGIAWHFWMKGELKKGKKESYLNYIIMIFMILAGIVSEIYINPKWLIL
jgi:hypothetical protein